MSALAIAVRLAIEVALACHCDRWVEVERGWRCVVPVDRARCELVEGWHLAGFGVATCSVACGRDD